jgi:formiminoglutamase
MTVVKFSDILSPVEPAVFFGRNDPNDVRLGEVVIRELDQYPDANVVVVGCPQDEGVKRNQGRPGAKHAPEAIRKALYRYPVGDSHESLRLLDLGDVRTGDRLEDAHDALSTVVREVVRDGKKAVVLGGGNDISYPDCSALSAEVESLLVFNIDRHLDVRADEAPSSGTPYRQLLEEGKIEPELFHEVGINSYSNSQTYIRYVEEIGAHIHYLGDLREAGVGATVRGITESTDAEAIFFGFDLDVVRAVDAPGVSDPSPMGLTARQVCEIADVAASDPRTRIVEITEVNPAYDVDGITAKLAANIIFRALAGD